MKTELQNSQNKRIICAVSLVLAFMSVFLLSPWNVKAAPEPGIYTTTDALNLRAGPGTNYDKVNNTIIPKRISITITEFSDDGKWGYTSYNGNSGWIYMEYTVKVTETPPSTGYGKSPEEVKAEIVAVYSNIRARRGQSYSGWCGQYVKDQLYEMKIGHYGSGSLNGNRWMTTLVTDGVTSYGYKQVKYYGKTCLDDILEANDGVAYNIIISFNGFYSSNGSYVPYGHVLLINAIIDGTVYYSESFSMRRGDEGEPQVYSLENFTNYYYNYFGDPIGAIHMTTGASLKPISGTKIESSASQMNITISESAGSADYDGALANLQNSLGSSERQVFNFKKVNTDGIFTIQPVSSETRVLTANQNGTVTLEPYDGRANQQWYFHVIDKYNYKYVIRSKSNPDLVLTADGTASGANVIMSKYVSGNNRQIWKIPTSQDLSAKVSDMSISPYKFEIATDNTQKLTVSLFPEFASNASITWSSDDRSIATVQGGTVKGVSKGMTVIRATLADGSLFAVCTVTVKDSLTLIGDANKDNAVDLLDFNTVTRYVNGDISASRFNIENADINRDGKINQADIDEYVKYFSGDETCILYRELGPAK